jgi:surface antigen
MKRIRTLGVALAAAFLLPAFIPAAPVQAARPADDVTDARQKLNDLDAKVETANADLDKVKQNLDADKKKEDDLSKDLAALARTSYEKPQFTVGAILDAASLQQLLANVAEARLIAKKEADLLDQATKLRQADEKLESDKQAALDSIKKDRDAAAQVLAQAEAAHNAAAAAQAQALVSPPSPPAGEWPNHMSFGYCTWYVANKRYVPWFGDAATWYANAQPYGFAEGPTPKVGAIYVGHDGEWSVGHVAYVEEVYPDGRYKVSEMNWTAWNVVDFRVITPGTVPLIGFIY